MHPNPFGFWPHRMCVITCIRLTAIFATHKLLPSSTADFHLCIKILSVRNCYQLSPMVFVRRRRRCSMSIDIITKAIRIPLLEWCEIYLVAVWNPSTGYLFFYLFFSVGALQQWDSVWVSACVCFLWYLYTKALVLGAQLGFSFNRLTIAQTHNFIQLNCGLAEPTEISLKDFSSPPTNFGERETVQCAHSDRSFALVLSLCVVTMFSHFEVCNRSVEWGNTEFATVCVAHTIIISKWELQNAFYLENKSHTRSFSFLFCAKHALQIRCYYWKRLFAVRLCERAFVVFIHFGGVMMVVVGFFVGGNIWIYIHLMTATYGSCCVRGNSHLSQW